ncbi:hypothetical protein BTHER_03639 [Brochothrix thermosphacta DSM 20171 = FSL F6-1036]|nr:hypothetical protein BTHER_03639 [Brochothrix thermosphacta DSM 20171 = FSL F6-1036]
MARDYMSIRLSYEAKFWLEKLQSHVQQVLDKSIDEKEVDDMEMILKEYLEKNFRSTWWCLNNKYT